jgi:hypothetical protein
MEPFKWTAREAFVYLTLVGVVIGILLGLVPLIYGRIRGKARLGLIGFAFSIAAGAIWSILPLFVMITFVFLIIKEDKKPPADTAELSDGQDAAAEVEIADQ